MTSISGYSKKELYLELADALTFSTIKSGNIAKACELGLELATSKGEMTSLLSFCINYFSTHVTINNKGVVLLFAKTCIDLDTCTGNGKSSALAYSAIHKVGELLVLIALAKKEHVPTYGFTNHNATCHNSLFSKAEKLYYDDRILQSYRRLFPGAETNVCILSLCKLCSLIHSIKSKQSKLAVCILDDILFTRTSKNTGDCSLVQPISFTRIKHLDSQHTADIVWAIWQGVLHYTKRQVFQEYDTINSLFTIASIAYKKKDRKHRIPLLYKIVHILCNEVDIEVDIPKDIISFLDNAKLQLDEVLKEKQSSNVMDETLVPQLNNNKTNRERKKEKTKTSKKTKRNKLSCNEDLDDTTFDYLNIIPVSAVMTTNTRDNMHYGAHDGKKNSSNV